jgi:hypothetical protein
MTQFQHYAFLTQKVPVDSWVLFFDDDDFSHPSRVPYYIDALCKKSPDVQVVQHPRVAIVKDDKNVNCRTLQYCNARVVEVVQQSREYFTFCIPVKLLRLFCTALDEDTLCSPLCDLVLSFTLLHMKIHCITEPELQWSYAYCSALGEERSSFLPDTSRHAFVKWLCSHRKSVLRRLEEVLNIEFPADVNDLWDF